MSHARHRFRILGFCLVSLCGLAALTAASAQAQWLLEIKNHVNVDAEFHEIGLLKVPTLAGGFEVHCKKVNLTEGLLLGEELTEPNIAHATIHFTECATFISGVAPKECDPVNKLILAKALVLPILHNGTTKLLFEPPPGETMFTAISIGGECALPIKNKLTGGFVAECLTEGIEIGSLALLDCLHPQANQLLRQVSHALGLAIGDTLKYGNHAAQLTGVMKVFTVITERVPFGVHAP